MSFFDNEVAAGLAVAVVGDLVEEARFVEIDQSAQCADDRALRIADRDGHADDRGSDGAAKNRVSDGGAAVLQGTGNIVAIHVVEADSLHQHRRDRNRRSIEPVGVDAGVEQVVKHKALIEESLERAGAIERRRVDGASDQFEPVDAIVQFSFELCGNVGHRRELLLPEHAFHVDAQHVARIERQRPQAGEKDRQRREDDPGLERAMLEWGEGHACSRF